MGAVLQHRELRASLRQLGNNCCFVPSPRAYAPGLKKMPPCGLVLGSEGWIAFLETSRA